MAEHKNRGIFEFGNWMLDFREDWSEWFRGAWNWRTFSLIEISYEDECYLGNREFVLRLLGLGVRVVHFYHRHAAGRLLIEQRMADFEAARAAHSAAKSEQPESSDP